MDKKVKAAALRLFNAYPIFEVERIEKEDYYTTEDLFQYGLVFHTRLKPLEKEVLNTVLEVFPRDKVHNNTFWSFSDTIKHEEDGTRIFYQILHYFSTYGLEALTGTSRPYIPNQEYGKQLEGLIKERLVIRALGSDDLRVKILELLNAPVGLSPSQITDVVILVKELLARKIITMENLIDLKNRDLRVRLLQLLDVPITDAELLIRYLAGGSNYRKIKSPPVLIAFQYDPTTASEFEKYVLKGGEELIRSMAESFYRNKEYWLSLKQNSNLSSIGKRAINKARKLAPKYHKPIIQKTISLIPANEFKEKVRKTPLPVLVRYYHYLLKSKERTGIFFIRNGKTWYRENWNPPQNTEDKIEIVHEEIAKRVEKLFAGVVFHPNHRIALPTSASNFIGNVPSFSEYILEGNPVAVGIHWFNLHTSLRTDGKGRVDLDLHLYDLNRNIQIGWHADWSYKGRTSYRISFSGDMTSAPFPYGASEYMLLYYSENEDNPTPPLFHLQVNDFIGNASKSPDFTFSFVILEDEYIDPRTDNLIDKIRGEHFRLLLPLSFKPNRRSLSLGYIIDRSFIFLPISVQRGRVFTQTEKLTTLLKVLGQFLKTYPRIHDFNVKIDSKNGITFQDLTSDFWTPYWKS